MMMMTAAQSSCAVQVIRHSSRVCQIRLDFDEFDLERPTVGNCDTERLLVTGHNANSVVPDLCGINTGQHGDDVPYVIQNVDANSAPTVAETEAGVGVTECPMDYVLLGGVRYCGTRLNPDVGTTNPSVNAPVTGK
ncbi:unnamed protein product, partial [Ixodes hexagonus]